MFLLNREIGKHRSTIFDEPKKKILQQRRSYRIGCQCRLYSYYEVTEHSTFQTRTSVTCSFVVSRDNNKKTEQVNVCKTVLDCLLMPDELMISHSATAAQLCEHILANDSTRRRRDSQCAPAVTSLNGSVIIKMLHVYWRACNSDCRSQGMTSYTDWVSKTKMLTIHRD